MITKNFITRELTFHAPLGVRIGILLVVTIATGDFVVPFTFTTSVQASIRILGRRGGGEDTSKLINVRTTPNLNCLLFTYCITGTRPLQDHMITISTHIYLGALPWEAVFIGYNSATGVSVVCPAVL